MPQYEAECRAAFADHGHPLYACSCAEDCPGPDSWNGDSADNEADKPPIPVDNCPHWHGRCDYDEAVAALVRIAEGLGQP